MANNQTEDDTEGGGPGFNLMSGHLNIGVAGSILAGALSLSLVGAYLVSNIQNDIKGIRENKLAKYKEDFDELETEFKALKELTREGLLRLERDITQMENKLDRTDRTVETFSLQLEDKQAENARDIKALESIVVKGIYRRPRDEEK